MKESFFGRIALHKSTGWRSSVNRCGNHAPERNTSGSPKKRQPLVHQRLLIRSVCLTSPWNLNQPFCRVRSRKHRVRLS
jgi:hypothetical protein